jgi:hypothetical protein
VLGLGALDEWASGLWIDVERDRDDLEAERFQQLDHPAGAPLLFQRTSRQIQLALKLYW